MFLWLQSVGSSSVSKSKHTRSIHFFHEIAFEDLSSVIIPLPGLSTL